MTTERKTRFQILTIALIVVCLLIGCTANSVESPVQATPSATGVPTHTLFPSPSPVPTSTSSDVEPTARATPILTYVQTASPAAHPTQSSAPTSTPTSRPTLLPTHTPHPTSAAVTCEPTPEVISTSYPYGVVYAYSKSDWNESDRQAIREQLEYLQGLGVNTIVQVFSSRLIGTGREKDWLILLDEAERVNMHVIARLLPLDNWDGQQFDFQPIHSFLAVVQDHPAFLAYLGLHEPLEQFDGDQLREFYAGVKSLAPEVTIAHYLGHMAWFENNLRFPNRNFTAGICDICIVWYYPTRFLGDQPAFEEDLIREIVRENRKLVDERAPDAQLWFLGQVYAHHRHPRQLRMPTPEEMEAIYTIAEQGRVDGFLWYPWLHDLYDSVLSDPDMEPQRQAVRYIYDSYVLQKAAP